MMPAAEVGHAALEVVEIGPTQLFSRLNERFGSQDSITRSSPGVALHSIGQLVRIVTVVHRNGP